MMITGMYRALMSGTFLCCQGWTAGGEKKKKIKKKKKTKKKKKRKRKRKVKDLRKTEYLPTYSSIQTASTSTYWS